MSTHVLACSAAFGARDCRGNDDDLVEMAGGLLHCLRAWTKDTKHQYA